MVNKEAGIPLADLSAGKVEQSGPTGDSFIYVDIGSIDRESKRITESRVLPTAQAPSRAKQVLRTGDVLVSLTRPNLNAVAIVPPELDGAIGSTGFHVIRPKDAESKLLYYAVQTPAFVDAMCQKVQGALYPAVRPRDVSSFCIPASAIEDQRRIVTDIETQFTRLDSGVAALKRVQANLKRQRASVLHAACSGKLVPTEAELSKKLGETFESGEETLSRIIAERRATWAGRGKYKEPAVPDVTGLPPLPNGWCWASLEQISNSSSYGTSTKCSYENHGIPVLRIPNVAKGQLDLTDLKFATEAEKFDSEDLLSKGDLLIIRTNGSKALIGRSAIVQSTLDQPTTFASYLIRFRLAGITELQRWIAGIWDVHFLREWVEQRAATSAGQHNISMSVLSTMPIPFPPLFEQQRIIAEVERQLSIIDELNLRINDHLKRAIKLRESILTQAFDLNNYINPIAPLTSSGEVEVKKKQIFKPLDNPTPNRPSFFSMRLLRFNLVDDFHSLKSHDYKFRTTATQENSIAPICLVGLNGSGKSNLIEAISEALCDTELSLLNWTSIGKKDTGKYTRFILEYELTRGKSKKHVKISKEIQSRPVFILIKNGRESIVNDTSKCLELLPSRVIAYSSGLNETLSIPYSKTATLYSSEVLKRAKEKSTSPLDQGRSLFLDYDLNSAILIAISLLAPKASLCNIHSSLRISCLNSFEIKIRRTYQGSGNVIFTKELERVIDDLMDCADEVLHDSSIKCSTLLFRDTEKCSKKIKSKFKNAINFFDSIYRLSLLNALALRRKSRKISLRNEKGRDSIERTPTISNNDKIFSINNIKLQLSKPYKEISYAAISDGEHQLIQVLGAIVLFNQPGTLFLLDEPETHFNPQWRRNFVQEISNIKSSQKQEFIVSTHSPFVVSGCKGNDVYKFTRDGEKAMGENVGFETFGASYDLLLTRLFTMKTMISEQAENELKTILKSKSLKKLEDSIHHFGDSFEKHFIFKRIEELKKLKKTGDVLA